MHTRTTAVLVSVAAFALRFLRLGAIENDHYIYIARAHQLLHGDWPVRNFADPGMPLAYLLSAVAAAAAGPTLLTEAILSVALFAVAVGVTYVLAHRASGSSPAALAAAAFVVAFPPRLYNSSKILVPLVAIALAWAYADRPTRGRVAALGAWTGVAFLFRQDYAVYIAAATAAFLLVQHWGDWKSVSLRAATFGGVALALAAPWLIYVAIEQGLVAYFAAGARYSLAEGQRTASQWRLVYYAMAAVPVATLLLARRGTTHLRGGQIAFATVLVLTSELVLLRDEPGARLPDVYAVTAVLAAVLAGSLIHVRSARPTLFVAPSLWLAAAGALALLLISGIAGWLPPRLDVVSRWRLVATRLRDARPEITPVPANHVLTEYIARCTEPDERVLVSGFAPEIPVLSHRAFAAGQPSWVAGYFEDPTEVARARRQVAHERLAVAVMLTGEQQFAASWPDLAADIRSRGLLPYELTTATGPIELWIRPTQGLDAETGLPCLEHGQAR